jgi:hypothetical protein
MLPTPEAYRGRAARALRRSRESRGRRRSKPPVEEHSMSDNERHSIFNPIRTTVVGGFVFLVPVVFVFILGAKALEIMEHIARPVVTALGVETRTILGIAIADLIIAAVIVGLCYRAGLMARSGIGTRFYAFIVD